MISLHAFLNRSEVPLRDKWQLAIDRLGYDFQIYSDFKPFKDSGFLPCDINKSKSGFEINYEDSAEYLKFYPVLSNELEGRDCCITFTYGSLLECACSLIASLALIETSNALIFYPNDNIFYQKEMIKAGIEYCLKKFSVKTAR